MSTDISRRTLMSVASAGAVLATSGARALAQPSPSATPLFGPGPGVALLSRNENPYGPAPSALKAMAEAAATSCYYSNHALEVLRGMVAKRYGLQTGNVVVGSGSNEILSALALGWSRAGTVISSELTWDNTVLYAEAQGAKGIRVPLAPDMSIDLKAIAAAITPQTGLIHIVNPNNPTGVLLDGDTLRSFIRSVPPSVTVVVDEAYMDLADKPAYSSVIDLVPECANLIVTRTFSKIYGLAGLRVGYSLSSVANAKRIEPLMMSFGGSTQALAAAIASFDDAAFFNAARAKVLEARAIIVDAVKQNGLRCLPSQTNFVYVEVPDANRFAAAMEARKIMVRGAYGKFNRWSRVSTGKIEDVKRYAAAIPDVLTSLG